MADDQPRPTENDNQDADGETPRTPETDREVRRSDDDSSTTDADSSAIDADSKADADAEIDDSETDSETDAPSEADDDASADSETDADAETERDETAETPPAETPPADVPKDVQKYARFQKMDGAQYDRVNEFLRDRTYITAREWAIARLCADFRTETGVEMTKIGENLPELVPFMTDTYTPQAVNQARSSFENKVRQAGATFLYGAMSGFFTAEELDDMMYEVTEVAKFLLEVEGVDLSVEEELEAEDRISDVMREVRSASEELRHDELACPNCGHEMEAKDDADASAQADD